MGTEPAPPGRQLSEPRDGRDLASAGSAGLLLGIATAVLVVVSAVVALATSSWQVVPVAVLLEMALLFGLVIYVYRMTRDSRALPVSPPEAGGAWPEPTLQLGQEVPPERRADALVAALRDVHAQQHGTRRFAEAFDRQLEGGEDDRAGARAVRELVERQREQAVAHERLLESRLRALGARRSRLTDDEAAVGAWLFERLLADGVATNARHAFALAELTAVSCTVGARLASILADGETERLMTRLRGEAGAIAAAWEEAWDPVLDLHVATAGSDGGAAIVDLLEQAQSMEEMRTSLLTLTASHEQGAGIAAGTEDAGLERLLWLVEQERAAAEEHRHALSERTARLGGRRSAAERWETLAAARTTALVETFRSFKVVRDVRDAIAADHLESATYDLLERAARRSGDRETAELARTLRDRERGAVEQLASSLDETLEVALLAGD